MLWEDISLSNNFDNFENDPEEAAMLYYSNNGSGRFKAVDKVDDACPQVASQAQKEIAEELLREPPMPEFQHELMKQFYEEMGIGGFDGSMYVSELAEICHSMPGAPIITCACCGIRNMERADCAFESVSDFDLFAPIQLTEIEREDYLSMKNLPPLHLPCNEEGNWKDYYLHKAFCVFEHNGDFHWLHDEFIDISSDGTVQVDCCEDCFACLKKNECPPFSLSRVNYGSARWIGLEPLTMMEYMMISKVWHHFCIKKIKSNTSV